MILYFLRFLPAHPFFVSRLTLPCSHPKPLWIWRCFAPFHFQFVFMNTFKYYQFISMFLRWYTHVYVRCLVTGIVLYVACGTLFFFHTRSREQHEVVRMFFFFENIFVAVQIYTWCYLVVHMAIVHDNGHWNISMLSNKTIKKLRPESKFSF